MIRAVSVSPCKWKPASITMFVCMFMRNFMCVSRKTNIFENICAKDKSRVCKTRQQRISIEKAPKVRNIKFKRTRSRRRIDYYEKITYIIRKLHARMEWRSTHFVLDLYLLTLYLFEHLLVAELCPLSIPYFLYFKWINIIQNLQFSLQEGGEMRWHPNTWRHSSA